MVLAERKGGLSWEEAERKFLAYSDSRNTVKVLGRHRSVHSKVSGLSVCWRG